MTVISLLYCVSGGSTRLDEAFAPFGFDGSLLPLCFLTRLPARQATAKGYVSYHPASEKLLSAVLMMKGKTSTHI